MSNYNYGQYIGEAIGSVLGQTYGNLELIVCDDGSTDQSCEIVQEYVRRDSRATLIRKHNGGQASGYNAAFRASHGEIICFIDSDDAYRPTKLERIVRAFTAHPEAGFVGHQLIRVDERRRPLGILPMLAKMPSGWQADYLLNNAGFLEHLAPGGGLGLRREIAERLFPVPEHGLLGRYGDAPLMRLAPLITPLIAIEEGLAEWRFHGSNFSHLRIVTAEYLRRELDVYREFWRLQRTFLESCGPGLASTLAPLEFNTHVVVMRYMLARLEDNGVLPAWLQVLRRRPAHNTDLTSRWFWPLSILLPRGLFCCAINLLTGPSRAKAIITALTRSLHNHKLLTNLSSAP